MSVRLNYDELLASRARENARWARGDGFIKISPQQAKLLELTNEVPVVGLRRKATTENKRPPRKIISTTK